MRACLVTLSIATVVYPRLTTAQPAAEQADVQFQLGRDRIAAGKYPEACAAFDASQKLDPAIPTLLNQASCREKNGQLATAWSLFVDAERQTRAATDEPTRKLHQIAAAHATRLEPRLSTLTIVVPDDHRIGGLEILRDGHRIAPDAWGTAQPVDGDTYRITARAPGSSAWSITVTVGIERDARTIEVPALAATVLVPEPARSPGTPAPAAHRRSSIPLVLAGGAVVLFGGAVGFAHWGNRTYDQSRAATDATTQTSLWRSANQKRYVAGAMLGAGIGCAGVAVWLWLRGRTESPVVTAARNREIELAPLVGSDMVGVSLGRRW